MEEEEIKENNKKKKRKLEDNVYVISIVVLLLVAVTVAYSLVSTSLTINGITNIRRSEWDVHMDSVETVTGRDLLVSPPSVDNNTTIVNFAINLNKVDDLYEFTIDAYNEGTVDAKVSSVIKSGLTSEQEGYVDYDITYADGTEIQEGDFLGAGQRRKLKVKVKYLRLLPLDEEHLDENIVQVSLLFKVEYVQN